MKYLTLHFMSLYNILVSPFRLNYWNKWTFAQYYIFSPVYPLISSMGASRSESYLGSSRWRGQVHWRPQRRGPDEGTLAGTRRPASPGTSPQTPPTGSWSDPGPSPRRCGSGPGQPVPGGCWGRPGSLCWGPWWERAERLPPILRSLVGESRTTATTHPCFVSLMRWVIF